MRRIALAALLLVVACGANPAENLGMSIPELKFAVIDSVGRPVYCDPDFYPLGRPEEPNAIKLYPQIRADESLYEAIVRHEHLPLGELDDAQKLTLYRAYKLLNAIQLTPSNADYTFEITVHPDRYELVDGVVRPDGTVTVTQRSPAGPPMCPICLAASTLIATPTGDVPVTAITVGMLVWSVGADGARVAAPVLSIGSTPVPAGHRMVHLVLADGRELLASPGHRVADGRPLGELRMGDALDGSMIKEWELVPYSGDRTYDLLPAGPTGEYWADGILLRSTLRG